MLGPAGEAFFVAEEIDTELLAFDKQGEESEQKQEGRISHHQQSSTVNPKFDKSQRVRSASEGFVQNQSQDILDANNINLDVNGQNALADAKLDGGYFLQEIENPNFLKDSPKSVKNIPAEKSGLWKSIFGYFRGPLNEVNAK